MQFSPVVLTFMLVSSSAYAVTTTPVEPFAHLAQGLWQGEITATVKKGDTLSALGGRYGVTPKDIATFNAIDPTKKLRIGQVVKIKYAHLIPSDLPEGITINLPQKILFHQSATKISSYALGLGRPSWPTPIGNWTITNKQEGKAWIVPKSIQAEMAREGKAVISRVPPGEDNPLGKYWLGLSMSGYGIHGTIAPSSIYHFQSHGCIRLHNDDIAELFANVDTGVTGSNNYWPILLENQANGHILLEVHPDIYRRHVNGRQELQKLADAQKISTRIDWTIAESTLKSALGMPVDITLVASKP